MYILYFACLGAVHSSSMSATMPNARVTVSSGSHHNSTNHETSNDLLNTTSFTPVVTTPKLTLKGKYCLFVIYFHSDCMHKVLINTGNKDHSIINIIQISYR